MDKPKVKRQIYRLLDTLVKYDIREDDKAWDKLFKIIHTLATHLDTSLSKEEHDYIDTVLDEKLADIDHEPKPVLTEKEQGKTVPKQEPCIKDIKHLKVIEFPDTKMPPAELLLALHHALHKHAGNPYNCAYVVVAKKVHGQIDRKSLAHFCTNLSDPDLVYLNGCMTTMLTSMDDPDDED